ncbi:MAG: hypothetical protein JW828_14385 [Sedimentisphaerales bacterium]|nr:hypothetical protein [Sedimentisphaerales bacterium]
MSDIPFPREHRLLWAVRIEWAAKTQHRLIVRPFVFAADAKAERVVCGAYAAGPTLSRWVYVGFQDNGAPFGFRKEKQAHPFPWPQEAGRVSELTADLVQSLEKHLWENRPVREYKFFDWKTFKNEARFDKNVDNDLLALRQLVELVATDRKYARRGRRRTAPAAAGALNRLIAQYAPHLLE